MVGGHDPARPPAAGCAFGPKSGPGWCHAKFVCFLGASPCIVIGRLENVYSLAVAWLKRAAYGMPSICTVQAKQKPDNRRG